MKMMSWDDLALFAAVARHGGLTRASDVSGVSPATLSRRMRAFETDLGRRLFRHGRDGYALTPDGRALYEKTERMEGVASEIAHWRAASGGPACVRISGGTWTSLSLTENLALYWQPGGTWVPEFVHCDLDMDIARREIDIGIRNRRPEQNWLAGQMTGLVQFAVYAASPKVAGWIGPAHGAPKVPSTRWILDQHAERIVTKANSPHLACSMAKAGIGRTVLPMFVGEAMDGLTRLGDPIEALTSEEWLVSHHEGRHEPAIHRALQAVGGFLKDRNKDILKT